MHENIEPADDGREEIEAADPELAQMLDQMRIELIQSQDKADRCINIDHAFVKLRERVPYVRKRDKSQQQGLKFNYLAWDDLTAACKPHTNRLLISVRPIGSPVYVNDPETVPTNSGGKVFLIRAVITFRFTHVPSGTWADVDAYGESSDSLDKTLNKVTTCALKNAFKMILQIESGDDDPDTKAAEQAGADYEQYRIWSQNLANPKSREKHEENWQLVQTRGFSDIQMETMRKFYDDGNRKLDNHERIRTNRPASKPIGDAPHTDD